MSSVCPASWGPVRQGCSEPKVPTGGAGDCQWVWGCSQGSQGSMSSPRGTWAWNPPPLPIKPLTQRRNTDGSAISLSPKAKHRATRRCGPFLVGSASRCRRSRAGGRLGPFNQARVLLGHEAPWTPGWTTEAGWWLTSPLAPCLRLSEGRQADSAMGTDAPESLVDLLVPSFRKPASRLQSPDGTLERPPPHPRGVARESHNKGRFVNSTL